MNSLICRLAVVLCLAGMICSPAAAAAGGATRCAAKNCEIEITLQVAFTGTDWDYIDRFVEEVEQQWNGPDSNPSTTGDCKCPFHVQVLTSKVDRCSEAPAGYHCVEVTNYREKPPYSANDSVIERVKKGEIDPKTSGLVTRHRGYLNPPGVSTGTPITGWWSDIMSTPLNGQKTLDFTHEAGHLMGLNDGDGGIMNVSGVVGPGAGVTQANIDSAVQQVCGENACPDRCCCGNGQIEQGKAEGCDPLANPSGCGSGSGCCPVCCNCFAPRCEPECGEYGNQAECTQNCTDPGEVCHINYYTGCWDCVDKLAVELADEYAGTKESIWKANETRYHPSATPSSRTHIIENALRNIEASPYAATLFAGERITLGGGDEMWHAVTAGGRVIEFGEGSCEDPTVRMSCSEETIERIENGELDFWTAFEEGLIDWEGVGVLNTVKFGIAEFILDMFWF